MIDFCCDLERKKRSRGLTLAKVAMDARRTNGIDKEKLSYIFIEFYATGLHLHKLSRPLKTY